MTDSSVNEEIPLAGQWPVDPQEPTPISKDRIWVDGCFDFSHHGKHSMNYPGYKPILYSIACILIFVIGHAGAMLQARRLGKELFVGVHSDEEILENKGPTVMTLTERFVFVKYS
jgi:ethanolamine-phosphate cytidylyltransferase